MANERFLEAAIRVADWCVTNQVTRRDSGDRGRFVRWLRVADGASRLSTNWTTGTTLIGLLAAHERTNDEKYLESARLAAGYLKSLQVLDTRTPHAFGVFREETPQTGQAHPRDALTAAWALLALHQVEPDQELLDRALIFADWFTKFALRTGYPAWTMYCDDRPWYEIHGSFHGGSPAFFHDLARVTGDASWIERASVPICDYYIDRFLKEDGGLEIVYLPEEDRFATDEEHWTYPVIWQHMHKYNDDFAITALVGTYLDTKDGKYLEAARRLAGRLMREQNDDGSYGRPMVASASGVVAMELVDLHRVTGDDAWLASATRAGEHLLTLQETGDDPACTGAIYGMDADGDINAHRTTLVLRATSYALTALLKLDGAVTGPFFTA